MSVLGEPFRTGSTRRMINNAVAATLVVDEPLREVKAGQNTAYTAVESAAGFRYDAPPLRQQRVLPKW